MTGHGTQPEDEGEEGLELGEVAPEPGATRIRATTSDTWEWDAAQRADGERASFERAERADGERERPDVAHLQGRRLRRAAPGSPSARRRGLLGAGLALAAVLLAGFGLLAGGVLSGDDGEEQARPAAEAPAAPAAPAPTAAPPPPETAAVVPRYYRRLAAGRERDAERLLAPDAERVPSAAGLVTTYAGPPTLAAGPEGTATATFAPFVEIRRATGCARHARAPFGLAGTGEAARIASFPNLAASAGDCACPAMPWPRTPPPGGVDPDTELRTAPGLRALALGADFTAEAAPRGWPDDEARPQLSVDAAGRVDWERLRADLRRVGYRGGARDMNVHVIFTRPTDVGCVSAALEGGSTRRRRSVTVTPDRTDVHETIFFHYPRGLHWSRRPLAGARGLTLHVNGVVGPVRALPPLRFVLWAAT